MIKHRCPWCGKYLPLKFPIRQILWTSNKPDLCPNCKNPYTGYRNVKGAVGLFFGIVIVYIISGALNHFKDGSLPNTVLVVIGFILLCLLVLGSYQFPSGRFIDRKSPAFPMPKKKTFAVVAWASHKQKGLLIPRFQIKNGEIFPACFINEEGSPISDALCVTLENLHWLGIHRCTCHISLVLDDVPTESLFLPGNQFYLYHNKKQIAKGTIEKIK